MTFDFSYALEIAPSLLHAAIVTLEATVGGMIFATLAGLMIAAARLSQFRPLSMLALAYIEFIRNTPLLVQLFFLFYVLPQYGLVLDAFATGVLGLGLHYSSYTAEVYRSGILSVPRGQWEAAIAINLKPLTTWVRIILPQALPPVIPALGNYLIAMFKETPLLSTIAVQELLSVALQRASESYRYFEPLTLVGVILLLLSYPAALLLRRIEVRFVTQREF